MKKYAGSRTFDGIDVRVNGARLDPRFGLRTYSKDGFEWSFEGDSPQQLALAIVADAIDDETALRVSGPFMAAIVANFDNDWEMTDAEVRDAIRTLDGQQSNNRQINDWEEVP